MGAKIVKTRGPDRRDFRKRARFPLYLPQGEEVGNERRRRFDQRRWGFLSRMELFSGVPFSAVEEIIASCPVRELAAGEGLLNRGDDNDKLYFVLDGRLRVVLAEGVGDEGITIGVGGCVGELSMVDGEPVSASVVALESVQVLMLPSDVVWERLIQVNKVARNLLRVLSGRMREVKTRMLEVRERRIELQRLQEQLLLARDIQTSMLPDRGALSLLRPEVECVGVSTPALEVGGDFFDVFFLGHDRLCVAVGDVSGKGIAAALLMARTLSMLRTEMLAGRALAEAMGRLNAALCVNNERCVFVTAYAAVLDLASGAVAYVDAGHLPALHRSAAGVKLIEDGPRGPCLGIMEEAVYQAGTLTLAPGDGLLLYSDGVTDAADIAGTPFRLARMVETLAGSASDSATAAAEAVLGAVAAHVGEAPAADDLTVLALRYRGPG